MTPFWKRIPKFFRFPAYRPVLLRIVAAALAYGAAGWLFGRYLPSEPLLGTGVLLAVSFGVWVFLARYGFLVIERTAHGYLYPDQYPPRAERASPYRPYKMFLIMMVVPMAIGIIGGLLRSPSLTLLLFLSFALLLPAAVMVLTMTDSFLEAVNPVRSLQVARKIGKPYLVLCLFLLLLLLSAQQAAELVLPRLLARPLKAHGEAIAVGASVQAIGGALGVTFGLAFCVLGLIGNYFFMLMCVLLGYTMYQYADVLGVSVVGPGEVRTLGRLSSAAHRRRVRDALIGQMVAAGEIREAIDLIAEDLRERPNDLALHGRLHKLLLIEGSAPRIADHAERYLELLVSTGNAREALPLVEEAFARRPDYEPRKPELVVPLAQAALAAGKPKLAAHLIRGFDRRHRMHPQIPNVYLIGAQLLLESRAPVQQARALLQHVIERYPQHAAAVEARRLLQRLPAAAAG